MNATVTTPQTTNRVNNKIEDFGQKIGGARKDYAAEAKATAEKFANIANPDALAGCKTLSAVVKLPNLESLTKGGAIGEDQARAILTTWRSIERKPTSGYYFSRVTRWARETAPKLARIAELMNGAQVTEEEQKGAEFRTLCAAGWPLVAFSFGAYCVKEWRGTLYGSDGSHESGVFFRVGKSHDYGQSVHTIEEAAALVALLNERDAQKRAEGPALAYSQNRARRWYIHPAHNENINIYTMPTGATSSEARQYAREHRAELVERLHALQQFPELRRNSNRPRVGKDWRKGENIQPEAFTAALPFYGVEFGNWVTYTERNILVNNAFDGFHDLAELWGIPAKACALGGSLAFAFGARGTSKAAAHYEPEKKVINLTKKNGAGCMAHEWFHAVDNWTMYRQGLTGYATEARKDSESEAERAGAALLEAIRSTEFYKRSQNLAEFKGEYWTKGRELAARGFESVCAFLMKSAGICSDFLVNCVSMDAFTAADVARRGNFYPYPSEAEAATLAPYYFAFMRAAFGEGVQMSAQVAEEVAELEKVAEREHLAEVEKRKAEAEAEAEQRAEVEKAAKDHREAMSEENRQKVEKVTADTVAETGAEWSHVFANGSYYYAVGGGRGFVFMVFHSGRVAFRMLRENGRIKKAFRGAHGVYIEHRPGVNVADVIREDLKWGFTGVCEMYPIFKNTYASTWEEFKAKHGEELAKLQKAAEPKKRDEVRTVDEPKAETGGAQVATAEGAEVLAERDGLQLVKMGEGVAIIEAKKGATWRNRKEIRANGGDWNKTAKQWQAVAAEDVARLCEWFGVSAQEQTAPTAQEVENVAEVAQPAEDANEGAHDEPTATADAEPVAEGEGVNVWQYVSNEGEQLHEIRRTPSGFFSITWNICEENGGGVFDYTKHKTHADALATLQAFRPGVKPYEPTEPQPTAPTEGGKAEEVAEGGDVLQDAEEISENGESSVIWHDMELTEHEAEHAEKLLTLLSRGVTVSFITSKGEKYEAKPTAKGCIFARPYGTTYGEALEDVAAMLATHTANDPAGHFKAQQPTEGAEDAPRYEVAEKSGETAEAVADAPQVAEVAEPTAQPAERPHVITFSAEDCPELPELTEPTAPRSEAVAESPRYEVAEKSEKGGAFGVFSFSVLGLNSGAPELLTTMPNERAACLFLSDAFAGRGAVSLDAVEVLARGGDWWVIYYSKRNGDVICDYVAPREGVGDLSGALTNADAWNLREQLADQWANIIAREEGAQIATLTEGAEYAAEYRGERVTVKPDTMNAGRYVVAWWCGDSMKEQNTDRTAEDAAEAVAMFAAYCVPFRIWNRGRNLSRITRTEAKRAAAF